MSKAVIQLETLTCPTCVKKIEGAVNNMDGVGEVNVLFNSSKVKATFDNGKTSAEAIAATIEKLGYKVTQIKIT